MRSTIVLPLLILLPQLAMQAAETHPETVDLLANRTPMLRLLERLAQQCEAELIVENAVTGTVLGEISVDARDVGWQRALDWFRDEHGIQIVLADGDLRILDHRRLLEEDLDTRWYDVEILQNQLAGHVQGLLPGWSLDGERSWVSSLPGDGAEIGHLVELIENITAGSWPDGTGIEEVDGRLLIRQSPAVHREIDAVLRELEAGMLQLIVARCWDVPGDVAIDGDQLAPEAWKAIRDGLSAPLLSHLLVGGRQQDLGSQIEGERLVDYDVIGDALGDYPIIVREGLRLDLEVSPTVAGLVAGYAVTTAGFGSAEDAVMQVGDQEFAMQRPTSDERRITGTRTIAPGGAAIIRLGDRVLAIELQLIGPADP